jgi:hypothetical protein
MKLSVQKECAGAWVPWYEGTFILNDATFDLDRCEVEIKLQKNDPEDCLNDNRTTELNLFEFAPARQTVTLYNNNILIEKLEFNEITTLAANTHCNIDTYWPGPGTPEAGGWVAYYNQYQTVKVSTGFTFIWRCLKTTKWARQTLSLPVTDPSPGAEWILINTAGGQNKWAKPAGLYNCVEEIITPSGQIQSGYKKECEILGEAGGVSSIDNGIPLGRCLQSFPDQFCSNVTVKSDFFQINPDLPSRTNYVTGLPSYTYNLLVYQKSDVKRPNVSGNATRALISWEKLINQLVEMFNVRWDIIGDELRIEHISWFQRLAGLNLNDDRYKKYITGKKKYSYKSEEIPAKEEFKFMEASAGDFTGVPITYLGGCVPQAGKGNTKTHAADLVTTDVELIMLNPDPKSSVVDDKGFCIIAADDSYKIISQAGILQTGTRLNNVLSWAHLHRDFHKHYRLQKAGTLNNEETTFLSVKPLKKGVPVTVPFCCGDTFNPEDIITTPLGNGTVEKATFNFKNETLTLDLLYAADGDLARPPIAINDVYNILRDAVSDFNIILNDKPGTAGVITGIEITNPPIHGTATIIAGPKIQYTPTTGYLGNDLFTYRVTDAGGIPSNSALVTVNIGSGIYVRLVKTPVLTNEQIYNTSCPPGSQIIDGVAGEFSTATYTLYFYSDAAGTVPADVTGIGLEINLSVVTKEGNNPSEFVDLNFTAAGFSLEYLTNYEFRRYEVDCDLSILFDFEKEINLEAGAYTII